MFVRFPIVGKSLKKRRSSMAVTIGVCTSAMESNVSVLLSKLRSSLPMITIMMVSLPYNDLDSFRLELQGLDGLILCHSINNRRLAITNVLDALYDKFLPRAKKLLSIRNVAVIAHDFSWPFQKKATLESFQVNQPTAVDCSSLLIFCGKLDNTRDNTLQMDDFDWNQLLKFAMNVTPQKRSQEQAPTGGSGSSLFGSSVDLLWASCNKSMLWEWIQSAMSLFVCIIVVIVVSVITIVTIVGLFPFVMIISAVFLLLYWFLKNVRHHSEAKKSIQSQPV
ncbi:uncharacterized protein LOC121410943 isoform X1 [Lytechinus variegatus]|uniref:uncharacterized protein LOC121410943 isoform X1 n=2 Tax=Lytechinus variegatus TaxID=7654 RepID=UPI001BB270FA|nr:uncharacterized protein LOC121410943 isoform X1 [Lytechinus variegatus]